MNLNKQRFDLNEVISCTIDDYRNQIKNSKRNIKLAFGSDTKEQTDQKGEKRMEEVKEQLYNQLPIQSSDNNISVEADKGRIAQVIDNLLNNALKFTNEGTISVSVESQDGQGIDPGILPKLFTKFASKSEVGGTGLGLFISKSIVEAHGGKIWAENNSNDNGGATFSFSLP
jgi:signal transduction histidine kinase